MTGGQGRNREINQRLLRTEWEWIHNIPRLIGHNENGARRKVHSTKCYTKKLESSHISNLAAHLKALEQKEASSPKRSRWQEIIKFRAKINKIETREQYKESTRQRVGSSRKSTK